MPPPTEALERLATDLGCRARREFPLAELTTWRVGGPAELVVWPAERPAAVTLAQQAAAWGCPLRVMGNGSNLLCPDQGVRGLVLNLTGALAATSLDDTGLLHAEAGAFLPKLAQETGRAGWAGLGCVVGVPGTVGGGVVLNAGIPSGTLGDALVEVEILTASGDEVTWPAGELGLAHRQSRLQAEPGLVLAARFQLQPEDPARLREAMAEHLAYRRRTQPLDQPTCGSVFRRPEPHHPGALIEQAGCKGLRRGGAVVSEKHANWIVNLGGATCAEITWLIAEIQRRVADQFGVQLVPEVIRWEPDGELA